MSVQQTRYDCIISAYQLFAKNIRNLDTGWPHFWAARNFVYSQLSSSSSSESEDVIWLTVLTTVAFVLFYSIRSKVERCTSRQIIHTVIREPFLSFRR